HMFSIAPAVMNYVLGIYSAMTLFHAWMMVSCEVFSSTSQIHHLATVRSAILDAISNNVKTENDDIKRVLDVFRRDVESLEGVHDAWEYVGHPVYVYHMLKHYVTLFKVAVNSDNKAVMNALTEVLGESLIPTEEDLVGWCKGIFTIQNMYNISSKDIASGLIAGRESKPLNKEDIKFIAEVAHSSKNHLLSLEWVDLWLSNVVEDCKERKVCIREEFREGKIVAETNDVLLLKAKAFTQTSQFSKAVHILEQLEENDPENDEFSDQMSKTRKLQSMIRESPDGQKHMNSRGRGFVDAETKLTITELHRSLCRGEDLMNSTMKSTLFCRYRKTETPFYQFKEEVMHVEPHISMFYDVLSDDEALALQIAAEPDLYRAKVGGPGKRMVIEGRTAKLTWIKDDHPDPTIKLLSKRVEHITGLSTQYRKRKASADAFQVVDYGIGGQYIPHRDYQAPAQFKNNPEIVRESGNRLATFMFYLTDVEAGGATVFPYFKVGVSPVKNAAVFWYDLARSGQTMAETLHAGCPVLLGRKWVANKWIREYGQEFRRPCSIDKDTLKE
ncbi:unnamed protein product, partial [Owenia fusiformis]